jgi:DNA modification methylase
MSGAKILIGDVRQRLSELDGGSVQTCITSPPYFGLRDYGHDGWYLRQDIIWAKPNPMPESVTDRCTKSHEYLFLLSKSARYHCDMDAIKEDALTGWNGSEFDTGKTADHQGQRMQRRHDPGKERTPYDAPGSTTQMRARSGDETRNKRDVWTISTKPFKGAHFAVMPEALVEPCVLAGSREGDLVLDPFAGSGTVGVVALRHQRNFVGTELNPEYAQMAVERIKDDAPMLNSVDLIKEQS